MTTYSEKLKDPRWQKKRLKIFERDNWTCVNCGAKNRTLHIHHTSYIGNPWDAKDEMLETLCEKCHDGEHSGKNKTFDIETFYVYDDCEIITHEYLLGLNYENSGNIKLPPSTIRWGISQVVKYTDMTNSLFKTTFGIEVSFSRKAYLESLKESLHKDCIRWHYYLKTDYGHFGSIKLAKYQNHVFPFGILNTIKDTIELKSMTDLQYKMKYKHSKFSRVDYIDNLKSGIDKHLKSLDIQFTYDKITYGL